jgi:hypothetical protein
MKKRNLLICYSFLFILTATFIACESPYRYEGGGYGISQPPHYVFERPPDVVALPDTDDVYVVPDINIDLFFWNGWWWRPWEGRWYCSNYYDQGWVYYNGIPSFYFDVDPGWRGYYRNHNWYGHRWNYERISHKRLRHDWEKWHNNRYWEKEKNWDVQGYQPKPYQQREELRHKRQEQYQQWPEKQRDQQQRLEQQKLEKQRLEQQRQEQQRIEQQRFEQKRLERQRQEQQRLEPSQPQGQQPQGEKSQPKLFQEKPEGENLEQ